MCVCVCMRAFEKGSNERAHCHFTNAFLVLNNKQKVFKLYELKHLDRPKQNQSVQSPSPS